MTSNYKYITKFDSPNMTKASDSKRVFGQERRVKSITIHHWGVLDQKFDNVISWFCNPVARASAHYVVQGGQVACIVDPDDCAWHAGNSEGNATSIGIELRPEATSEDYATAAELIAKLRSHYGDIPLIPHSDWRPTVCPGRWDLKKLDAMARGNSEPENQSKTYTVEKGDTLYGIARKFNISLANLLNLNGLSKPKTIYVGDTIKVSGGIHKTPSDVPMQGYISSEATHNGFRIKYYTWKPINPKGVVIYLHGDNKPQSTTSPGGSYIHAMAKSANDAGYAFVLPISPKSTWWMTYTGDNQSTEAPQLTALRTFIPAIAQEVGVPRDSTVIVGHSGGAEAITLHLARTNIGWSGGKAKFGLIGGGTPNSRRAIDTPMSFRKNSPMYFFGSKEGDGVGATTANNGAWSAWASATSGSAKYRAAGHYTKLTDTKAESHTTYNFGAIIKELLTS